MNKITTTILIGMLLVTTGCSKSFVSKLYGIPKKQNIYIPASLSRVDIGITSDNVQWADNRFPKAEALTVYSCDSKTDMCIRTPYVDEATNRVAIARLVPFNENIIQIINFKKMFPENDIARIVFTTRDNVPANN